MSMVRAAVILGVVLAGCLEPRTECSPTTCAGCCSTNGTCEGGDQFEACGLNGGQCSVCSGSQRCEAAVCGAGTTMVDAGSRQDAGAVDAGLDAGAVDAGWDAGADDAGWDAGTVDAGQVGAALSGRLWMWGTIGPVPAQVFAQVPVGAPTTTVSAPGRNATGMAVTQDGAMIAISYDSPSELFVGPTDGGPARLVRSAAGFIRVFGISPDKGHVAFTEGYAFNDGVMIMPLDGGPALEATPRTTNYFPRGGSAFSPDSSHFAWAGLFDSSTRMYVTDTLTGTRTQVAVPPAAGSSIMKFAWTSDTTFWFVAFSSTGGSLHGCSAPAACAPLTGMGSVRSLSLSGDRTFAVIGVDSADAGPGPYLDISRVSLDGGAATAMATNFPLNTARGAWVLSPDGERLMTQGLMASDRALFVMPTSAFSSLTPLFILPSGVGAESAVFSPDSMQLIFRSNLEGFGTSSPDGWGLQRIDLTSPGQPPVLQQRVDGGIVWDFVWTP